MTSKVWQTDRLTDSISQRKLFNLEFRHLRTGKVVLIWNNFDMFPDKAQHSSEDANYNSLDTQNSNPDRNRPEISNEWDNFISVLKG